MTEVLIALTQLLETASAAATAAQAISQLLNKSVAEGVELTLDDVKSLAGLDDKARDALTKAINEAEGI